jgi:hypothetical protein
MKKITCKILLFATILSLFNACTCTKLVENAIITYHNGYETNASVCCKNRSFFSYIKILDNETKRFEKILPDEIKHVDSEKCKLIAIKFDAEEYGTDSYSFGKILAGEKLMLTDTRYRVNTCNCAGKDVWYNAYFIVFEGEKLKLKTNNAGKLFNLKTVYDFILEHTNIELNQNVSDINKLTDFIKNINNSNF